MSTQENKDKKKKQLAAESEISKDKILDIIMDNIPDFIYFKDRKDRFVMVNKASLEDSGLSFEEMVGKTDFDLFPGEDAEKTFLDDKRIMETKKPLINKIEKTKGRWMSTSKVPWYGKEGRVMGIIGISRNITELKQAEEELKKHRERLEEMVKERTGELTRVNETLQKEMNERKQVQEIITRQAEEILELSTPIVQAWRGIIIAILIGTLDSKRTQQFMEHLLERIVQTNSPIAIVDITGVPTIDTQTGQHLVETISAVQLLGARVILTGMRPAIARTLVHLGIDLSSITTHSSLEAGLRLAMDVLNLKVVDKSVRE